MNFPRATIRPAKQIDMSYLAKRLAEKSRNEQVDLNQAIVFVVEYGENIVGFSAARLIWQIEPVMLFDEFKHRAPHIARQRATYLLITAVDRWIADRARNTTGIHSYFCFVKDRVMQKLATHFGLLRIYVGGKFFGRDL